MKSDDATAVTRRGALRGALHFAALGGCGALLGACGFELRRVPELQFKTIALVGFAPRSPMLEELRLNLNGSTTTTVVETPAAAQVVFEVAQDARERSVTASTSAGQVRTFQLRVRLKFLLRTPAGATLVPLSEITLVRDMSYSESLALAKEQEEAQLFRAMQSDIVAQVMRRLATVTLPAA
jgi:LPS-assembly lipoprotein